MPTFNAMVYSPHEFYGVLNDVPGLPETLWLLGSPYHTGLRISFTPGTYVYPGKQKRPTPVFGMGPSQHIYSTLYPGRSSFVLRWVPIMVVTCPF
jgi:hypothetical protein